MRLNMAKSNRGLGLHSPEVSKAAYSSNFCFCCSVVTLCSEPVSVNGTLGQMTWPTKAKGIAVVMLDKIRELLESIHKAA